ncbi:hypothetical protein QKP95_gp1 [Entoleuca hypovirus 1]|uniref:Uncharacterized protein n=1 Tax=Entoleuca hypovirus 1 TaxID=2086643 RepID=A0AAD0HA43_9VIRU|nr:hypothetical protein QKP95_gp1 [Entoleuca hypovirus 1]AVK39792.1 hypothetical protein [Entoleuca hypovirus 1]
MPGCQCPGCTWGGVCHTIKVAHGSGRARKAQAAQAFWAAAIKGSKAPIPKKVDLPQCIFCSGKVNIESVRQRKVICTACEDAQESVFLSLAEQQASRPSPAPREPAAPIMRVNNNKTSQGSIPGTFKARSGVVTRSCCFVPATKPCRLSCKCKTCKPAARECAECHRTMSHRESNLGAIVCSFCHDEQDGYKKAKCNDRYRCTSKVATNNLILQRLAEDKIKYKNTEPASGAMRALQPFDFGDVPPCPELEFDESCTSSESDAQSELAHSVLGNADGEGYHYTLPQLDLAELFRKSRKVTYNPCQDPAIITVGKKPAPIVQGPKTWAQVAAASGAQNVTIPRTKFEKRGPLDAEVPTFKGGVTAAIKRSFSPRRFTDVRDTIAAAFDRFQKVEPILQRTKFIAGFWPRTEAERVIKNGLRKIKSAWLISALKGESQEAACQAFNMLQESLQRVTSITMAVFASESTRPKKTLTLIKKAFAFEKAPTGPAVITLPKLVMGKCLITTHSYWVPTAAEINWVQTRDEAVDKGWKPAETTKVVVSPTPADREISPSENWSIDLSLGQPFVPGLFRPINSNRHGRSPAMPMNLY